MKKGYLLFWLIVSFGLLYDKVIWATPTYSYLNPGLSLFVGSSLLQLTVPTEYNLQPAQNKKKEEPPPPPEYGRIAGEIATGIGISIVWTLTVFYVSMLITTISFFSLSIEAGIVALLTTAIIHFMTTPVITTIPIWLIAKGSRIYEPSFLYTLFTAYATEGIFLGLLLGLEHVSSDVAGYVYLVGIWVVMPVAATVVCNLTKKRKKVITETGTLLQFDNTGFKVGLPVITPLIGATKKIDKVVSINIPILGFRF